ncbi:MAG: hypothetical protein KAH01_02710 [Caldisericia bacterium]|nr:hypothetical protein [Caldisericia bacterium]
MKILNKTTQLSYFTITLVFFLILLIVSSLFWIESKNTFASGSLKSNWTIETTENITSHAISEKGSFIAVGSETGLISIFNEAGELLFDHQFEDPILDIEFTFDESSILVKCYSVFCIDITEQRTVWEKFYKPENFFIQDFWVFKDGKIGFLASSLHNLENYYFLTNSEGATIETPKKLPDTYSRYKLTPSPDGKLLIWSTGKGVIECISYYAFVHWNKQISVDGNTSSKKYPFLQDISNDGNICISFKQRVNNEELYHLFLANIDGVILWQTDVKEPITKVSFSQKKDVLLVTTSSTLLLYDLSGDCILSKERFGYKIDNAEIFYSNFFITYTPKTDLRPFYLQKEIVELNWRKHLIWRKHSLSTRKTEFSLTDNGLVFIEVNLPNQITYFKYQFSDQKRKV